MVSKGALIAPEKLNPNIASTRKLKSFAKFSGKSLRTGISSDLHCFTSPYLLSLQGFIELTV